MGAICGIVYPKLFPVTHAVQPALDSLASRNPGEAQTYLFKNVEIGTRGEPLGYDDHRAIVMAIDGEISNRRELENELRKAGFQVDSLTLPELIVRAYEKWGIDCTRHIEGSFAIALFDQKTHELILLRDPLGIKPLYWTYINRCFLFASELKALLATGMIPQSPARDAISAYLFFGYIPQDLSPIENVQRLLPGHHLRYSEEGNIRVESYWSYSRLLLEHPPKNAEERTEVLGDLISQATARQLPDGPITYGATGSAGSTFLAQTLATWAPDRTTAVITEYAADIADHFQPPTTPSLSLSISPADLVQDLARVVWQLDEPAVDPSAIALWRLFSQGPTTYFSDVGSEEILAAHSHYPLNGVEAPILTPWGRLLSKTALPLISSVHTKSGLRFMHWLREAPWYMQQIEQNALFNTSELKSLSPELSRHFAPDIYLHRFHNLSNLGMTPAAHLYFDTRILLADKLLPPYDRLSAPHGVTWRSPYLDPQVVDFIARLPDSEKLNPDESLRPLQRLLPGQQFIPPRAAPLSPWLHDATLRQAFEKLQSGTLVEAGWLSKRWLRNALAGNASFTQLWSLLSLEVWLQLFINAPVSTEPPTISTLDLIR